MQRTGLLAISSIVLGLTASSALAQQREMTADEIMAAFTAQARAAAQAQRAQGQQGQEGDERVRSMRVRGNSNFRPADVAAATPPPPPSVSLNQVTFETNSDKLDLRGRQQLEKVVEAHKKMADRRKRSMATEERSRTMRPDAHAAAALPLEDGVACESYNITGHTDLVGSHDYNDALSARRAKAVALYLEQRGVPVRQDRGLGKRKPAVERDGPVPENRRVEVGCNLTSTASR